MEWIGTYEGDTRSESLRLVLGCFWMVSSCPSSSGNWICCGEGTGIRFASFEQLDLKCIRFPNWSGEGRVELMKGDDEVMR